LSLFSLPHPIANDDHLLHDVRELPVEIVSV